MGQECFDEVNVVIMNDDACLLGVTLDCSRIELGLGNAIGSDGPKVGDGANLVQVSASRYPSH